MFQDLLVLRIHEPGGARLVKIRDFPATIGRSVFGDVAIEVDGVSLKHAVIERLRDGFLLRDLGSKNGLKVGGTRVPEHVFSGNGSAMVGPVRVDLVLSDESEATRVGLVPHADWGGSRVAKIGGIVLGLYLAVCAAVAIRQFGNFWPPEKPSEIFTAALVISAGLAVLSFFASLLSKLNTRRFNYLRLFGVVTVAAVGFLLLNEVTDWIEYNVWLEALRSTVPSALFLLGVGATLTTLMHMLFPGWRRVRLGVATVLVTGFGAGLHALEDHYSFEESDMRSLPPALGLPVVDPSAGAHTTAELLTKVGASVEIVNARQKKAREEIDADEVARGRAEEP